MLTVHSQSTGRASCGASRRLAPTRRFLSGAAALIGRFNTLCLLLEAFWFAGLCTGMRCVRIADTPSLRLTRGPAPSAAASRPRAVARSPIETHWCLAPWLEAHVSRAACWSSSRVVCVSVDRYLRRFTAHRCRLWLAAGPRTALALPRHRQHARLGRTLHRSRRCTPGTRRPTPRARSRAGASRAR